MRHRSIAVLLAALASVVVASITVAGGWAEVTARDVPVDPPAGQETTIQLDVLQHEVTPVSWPGLTVVATDATTGTVVRAQAKASGPAGSYVVAVPTALGPPDAVYLGDVTLRGQVALIYAPRDGVPASGLLGGAGLLITQNRGEPDDGLAHKLAESGQATVEPVDVSGAPGVWISGQPHFFWYLAPDGFVIEESRRLVGDTLAWERNGILYRIEGAITIAHALEIARSMR